MTEVHERPRLPRRNGRQRRRRILLAILGLVAVALAAWGILHYVEIQRTRAVAAWDARLSALADDRVAALEAWVQERWADARTLANILLDDQVSHRGGPASRTFEDLVAPHLTAIKRNYGYAGVYVLGADGRPAASAAGSPPVPRQCLDVVAGSAATRTARAFLYRGGRTGRLRIGFLKPLDPSSTSSGILSTGWILLSAEPTRSLFPFLTIPPSQTLTEEAVLAQRDGGQVIFINPLLFKAAEPLSFHMPLDTPTLAASHALRGQRTFGEFTDYRGVPIYAAVRPIRGTDWGLVVKVDRSVALAPFRRSMALQGIALATLLLVITLGGLGLWRGQRMKRLQAVLDERTLSAGRVLQLNRLLRTISEINQLMAREGDSKKLLSEACHILVEHGEFVMAWVGLRRPDGTVEVAAKSGDSTGYLDGIAVRWDDTPEGRGPTGTSIREGRNVVNPDVTLNPAMAAWRAAAVNAGYLASAAFPIPAKGGTVGAITVYVREANGIAEEEVALLEELANNLGFVLEAMEDRQERERAEKALRASERKYQELAEHLGEGVGIVATDETFLYSNPAQDRIFGVETGGLTGRNLAEFSTPEEFARYQDGTARRATGKRSRYETTIRRPDGELRNLLVTATPHIAQNGEFAGTFAICMDVTEEVKATKALRESEEKYRNLVENASDLICTHNMDGVLLSVNEAAARAVGYAVEELIGRNLQEFVPSGQEPAVRAYLEALERDGTAAGILRTVTRQGDLRFWEYRNTLRTKGLETPVAQGIARDVTERVLTQRALRKSEARYRSLFERNLAGVYRSTGGGRLIDCNQAFARIYGFASPGEAMRDHMVCLYDDPKDREAFLGELRKEGHLGNRESQGIRKDGSTVWVLENVSLEVNETTGEEILDGTIVDITQMKEAEAQRAMLSSAIEQGHDSVVITDKAGDILYVNPAFERITGYGRDEAIGKTPRILKSGVHDESFYRHLWETILSGGVWSGRLTNKRKDGELFVEQASIFAVRDEAGHVTAFVAVKRDITKEQALEQQLVEAKKLETVGMIASGVAHEVRNPLFAITTIVAALEKKLHDESEYGEYLAHIKDQSGRLNLLMNDLLTLGRPIKPEQLGPCLLRDCLTDALKLLEDLEPGIRERIALEIPSQRLPILGAREKLVQVILNILQNSLHFSPREQKITASLRKDGTGAVLHIVDSGPGIAPSLLPTLFEPFQTGRKGGTGLGLAIVRQIVTAHGGTVSAKNNDPPPGATFTISLPIRKGGEADESDQLIQ